MTHRGPFQPRTFCDSVNSPDLGLPLYFIRRLRRRHRLPSKVAAPCCKLPGQRRFGI